MHIATLGLHANQRIEHVVMKKGADKVVLVYTKKNEHLLPVLIDRFEKGKIFAEGVLVHPWDYRKILASILSIVVENEEYEVVEFNVSCGTRVMTAATYAAAALLEATVYVVSENDTDVVGELVAFRPLSLQTLLRQKRKILTRLLKNGGAVESMAQLGSRESLGASSVSKHVKALERMGLVTKKAHGRKTSVAITDLGKIILRLRQIRNPGTDDDEA